MLNITNGDAAVEVLTAGGVAGEFLPWRDVLHEGPVPGRLPLDALSAVRARFIASRGWGTAADLRAGFADRDRVLRSSGRRQSVVLWFEHDLYDQLQLLQVLDWFAEHGPGDASLTLVCTDRYLGCTRPEEVDDLRRFERPVSNEQLDLARTGWAAFRADTPEAWQDLLDADTAALPFLDGAVRRLLEEYPHARDGLARSARQVLEVIAAGASTPGEVFTGFSAREDPEFMGDWSLWAIVSELVASTPPLVALPAGGPLRLPVSRDLRFAITAAGREVLDGRRNWLDDNPVRRWLGGVSLVPGRVWCRDDDGRVRRWTGND